MKATNFQALVSSGFIDKGDKILCVKATEPVPDYRKRHWVIVLSHKR